MKDINLIPKSYIIEKKNKIKKVYLSVVILIIGFIVTMIYIVPTVYEYNLKSEKVSLEKQVSQTNNFVVLEKEFNSLKQAIETREQEGKLLSQKQINLSAALKAVEVALPDKLFIQKFDCTGENESDIRISLKGGAESEEEVASFIRNLLDDGYFNDVNVTSLINTQDNNGYNFDISIWGIRKNDLTSYKEWESGFSIGYPADWSISKEEKNHVLFTAGKTVSSAKPASLEVLAGNSGSSIDDFTNERHRELKEKLKNFNIVYTTNTRISKIDVTKTLYFAEEDGIRYKYLEICTVKNNKSYIATYKCDSVSFSNKARTIDRILNSFNLDQDVKK